MGQACDTMNKRLAGRIAERKGESYAHVINHFRTRLRFSLLRGILMSLTAERSKNYQPKDKNAGDYNFYETSFNTIPWNRHYEAL
jgi:hypothetical protein